LIHRYQKITAHKAAIAHHAQDPARAMVRPPLVPLGEEPARALTAELDQRRFAMPGLRG
jgi:hypothetical protein